MSAEEGIELLGMWVVFATSSAAGASEWPATTTSPNSVGVCEPGQVGRSCGRWVFAWAVGLAGHPWHSDQVWIVPSAFQRGHTSALVMQV